MTVVNRKSTRMKYFKILNYLMDTLKESKELDIIDVSIELGYNPDYFKRTILPIIKKLSPCIDYDSTKIHYTCKDQR